MNDQRRDRELGLNRRITRRDFLDGVRLAGGQPLSLTARPTAKR